jgi:hypothetical protein
VDLGWLVNALQTSPTHTVKLLPGGEAHLEEGPKTTVRQAGKTLSVTEFLVTGLDFVPTPVWLDQDNRFFAAASAWLSVIREGWESANDELLKLQDAADDARYRGLAQKLGRHSNALVIRHVRLFDSVTVDVGVYFSGYPLEQDFEFIRYSRGSSPGRMPCGEHADPLPASRGHSTSGLPTSAMVL